MSTDVEIHELESGQIVTTHPVRPECITSFCPIHNPSWWRLAGKPRVWHPDTGLVYRVCEHTALHVDLDDQRIVMPTCHCDCDCCGFSSSPWDCERCHP